MKVRILFKGALKDEVEVTRLIDIVKKANIDSIIKEELSNDTGYMLEKVWVETTDEKTWLHVIGHGNENLIGYDEKDDPDKELIFELETDEKLETGIIEVPLNPEKEFNLYTDYNKCSSLEAVGIFIRCLNHLTHSDPVSLSFDLQFPSERKPPAGEYTYTMKLYERFQQRHIKRTKKNEKVFNVIDSLIPVVTMEKGVYDFTSEIYYYKTLRFFEMENKMTELAYLRKKSGKTQTEIAKEADISLRQYQRYEALDSSMGCAKMAVVERIADAVGATSDQLVYKGVVVLHKK